MSAPRLEDLISKHVKLRPEGRELKGLCPFHSEKSPSFFVDPDKQAYKCFGCGKSGRVYNWLVDHDGMDKKEAFELAGLGDGKIDAPAPAPQKPEKKVYVWDWEKITGEPWFVCDHKYFDADGKLLYTVVRHDKDKWVESGKEVKRFAKCRAFHEGEADGKSGWIAKMPLSENRPLYRIQELNASPKAAQVMIVEGEKAADAAVRAFPKAPVTTWTGGTSAWERTDWSPVEGRDVLLVADHDKPGRKAMKALAVSLGPKCNSIKLVLPPGDTGDDMYEWVEKGGAKEASRMILQYREVFEPKPEPKLEAVPEMTKKNDYFDLLGNIHDSVAIMLNTHRVLTFSRSSMTSPATLIAIADFNWWCSELQSQGLPPAVCQNIGSFLIRMADKKGQIDMSKMIGRGFYRTHKGNHLWHLGDRLLVDNQVKPLGSMADELIALAGPRIGWEPATATLGERQALADAVLKYRWERPRDGKIFMGWLLCSMIGGALEWRPHVWISAPAATGKSWILKTVAENVLGDMSVKLADATPAAISRRMGSDSLPMLLDEAEPDRQWIEGIMDVIRISAGGDGERIRADGADSVQSFQPRFSAMLSSVKLANLSGADASRFAMINLSNTPVEDWFKVSSAIESAVEGKTGQRFRAGIMKDGQDICAKAVAIRRKMIEAKYGTRQALIYSALSAAWQWWSGTDDIIEPDHLEGIGERPEEDAPNLLRDILGIRLRTNEDSDVSIIQLIDQSPHDRLCSDYGIRRGMGTLMVAVGHPSLKAKMERTRWRGVDIKQMLCQMDGVEYSKNVQRFGALRMRCVTVPDEVCRKHGIDYSEVI